MYVRFVPMFCNCQGKDHRIFNNCLNCGRISCVEEKAECSFCGEVIERINDYERLKYYASEKEIETAVKLQEKLYNFDKSTNLTKVIDDHNEWFEEATNKWLSEEGRSFAKQRAEEREIEKDELEKFTAVDMIFDEDDAQFKFIKNDRKAKELKIQKQIENDEKIQSFLHSYENPKEEEKILVDSESLLKRLLF